MDNTRYEPSIEQCVRLGNDFTYHPPFGDQTVRYTALRAFALDLAYKIVRFTPPSREQSLSLTALDEAVFWANAAIARNEREPANGD